MENKIVRIVILALLVTVGGCGHVREIKNVPFKGADTYEYNGQIRVGFEGVIIEEGSDGYISHTVLVDGSKVRISVDTKDTKLTGTTLTIIPEFSERVFAGWVTILRASRVTVNVQTPEEADNWRSWLDAKEKQVKERRERILIPRQVIPGH